MWTDTLRGDPLPWLLEPDAANPGVRALALRELLDLPDDDPEVRAAQAAAMASGPVAAILDAQSPDGFWVKPGGGYSPKYRGTMWQIIFLAQLGAVGADPRVRRGCEYVLEHSRTPLPYGGFSISVNASPSGQVHCLGGNLCAALLDLDWLGDPRLDQALDWLARSVTGEGIAPADQTGMLPHFYRCATSAPGFVCAANAHQPCAWGAVKVLLALGKAPEASRTPAMRGAIEEGIRFLLGRDPAAADYPTWDDRPPSGSWFRFAFPVAYVTDVLQNLEALTALGYGGDPRLRNALDLVLSKQDAQGRWRLEYDYRGKTWADVEEKGRPSKWVTLRALRVLKRAAGADWHV
jgi:hypothetical protein